MSGVHTIGIVHKKRKRLPLGKHNRKKLPCLNGAEKKLPRISEVNDHGREGQEANRRRSIGGGQLLYHNPPYVEGKIFSTFNLFSRAYITLRSVTEYFVDISLCSS